jgi:hypothetical protein
MPSMISVVHASHDELMPEEDCPIALDRRDLQLDWDAVAAAFKAAGEQLAWNADFHVCRERRRVEIVVPEAGTDHVARTTLDFYGAVADRIGMDEFLSIWVDFDVAHSITLTPPIR